MQFALRMALPKLRFCYKTVTSRYYTKVQYAHRDFARSLVRLSAHFSLYSKWLGYLSFVSG